MANHSQQVIRTTCPYCGVGCGIDVTIHQGNVLINGDKRHPANLGKLCIKGKNLGDTLANDNRLSLPLINQQPQPWSRALDYVASKLNQTIDQYGKDSVAFYVSGQLLTEDYYVANKLMKGFIGSGNIDTNSRLCMSSAVAAHKRAFGEDIVPLSYSDITKADLIVLAGSNLAWCHPVIYQRIRDEKQRRPELKLVVIDPRVTASTELADLHLPIKAGGDLVLFNGLLNYMSEQQLIDQTIASGIDGVDAALANAAIDSKRLTEIGLTTDKIEQFYKLFMTCDKVVTLFSQGINQSAQGTDQCSAIINCHLASGKIGRDGCGPFSITGQPNAMGGREVGALANTLACHVDFGDAEQHQALSDFWQTDNLATAQGLKAVDLFEAMNDGKIKAIWIIATNPLVSLPDHAKITAALKKCPLVIVSDCVATNDTIKYANVVLPAQAWGEKSGTVTNSERRISRQRSFLTPYGEAKPDWWILSQIAKRMGFAKQFDYQRPRDIFVEHAALSGLNNNGTRAFDISAFSELAEQQYKNWIPVQWPQRKGQSIVVSDQSLFGDNKYYHANNRPKMVAVSSLSSSSSAHTDDNLFTLNTGRNRDQWHTQTRTGKSAVLTNRHPEPEVEIHPDDAIALGIKDRALVRLSSEQGQLLVRAKFSKFQRRDDLFMPIHWSHSNSNQGCVSQLIAPKFDPVSGQPAFKHSKASLAPWHSNSEALLVVKETLALDICTYQVEQPIEGGYCYHLASDEQPAQLFERLSQLITGLNRCGDPWDSLNASDPNTAYYRKSYLTKGQLIAGVLVGRHKAELPDGWISQFYLTSDSDKIKRNFISNDVKSVQQQKIFCQCLSIPLKEIRTAIANGELSVAEIRKKTGAGNGCGSCIGDISLAVLQTQLEKNT